MHLSKSLRKFVREEKARIRREVFDLKEQKRLIAEIYDNFSKKSGKTEKPKEIKKEAKYKKEVKKPMVKKTAKPKTNKENENKGNL